LQRYYILFNPVFWMEWRNRKQTRNLLSGQACRNKYITKASARSLIPQFLPINHTNKKRIFSIQANSFCWNSWFFQ